MSGKAWKSQKSMLCNIYVSKIFVQFSKNFKNEVIIRSFNFFDAIILLFHESGLRSQNGQFALMSKYQKKQKKNKNVDKARNLSLDNLGIMKF